MLTLNDDTFNFVKRAKQQWEATIDSLPELVCLLDSQQRIQRCNRIVEHWNLGSVKTIQDIPAAALFKNNPDFIKQLDAAWQRLPMQESTFEVENLLFGRHFQIQVFPLAAETTDDSYSVMVVTDITERKFLEKRAIEFALEKERANLLREFITDVTHDFKNPLAIINSSIYLYDKTDDLTKRKTYARRIEQQVDHLNKMVDSLLAMVQLSQKSEFEFKLADVNKLMEEVKMIMQDEAVEKGHSLTLLLDNTLPTVPLEIAEIRQAVCNLVENALNYTDEGGQIFLRTYTQHDYLVIEVEDTGIGISEEDLPHIFKRFYRADKARQIETGRAGLGLPFVKNVVDVHMGRVEVESALGAGSIFRIFLPISG